jgi:membrane-bound inhibitor of C-type lysozyme
MNRTLTTIVALVIVAGGAYYFGMQRAVAPSRSGTTMSGSSSAMTQNTKITETTNALIGVWSSVEDRNFNREYKADGTAVDSYASAAGDITSTDTWSVFTADTADGTVKFPMDNADAYVKQTMKDGSVLYFRVTALSDSRLQLVNMDRGGVLNFDKLKTGAMADGSKEIVQKYDCKNGMVFSANLTREDQVTVWADGTEPSVLPRVASANGRKYSNGNWEYFFSGENVTVTDVKAGKSSVCTPVSVPGTAPVNVGN